MRIEVAGIPAPQGSKRYVGGGRMVEQSRAVGPWREAVRAETQRAVYDDHQQAWGSYQPVAVKITFFLPRPKSTPKSVIYPAKQPDLDKLCRAVLDGIVAGGAIADDGQVMEILAGKFFATPKTPPGCHIEIEDA